MPDSRIHVLDLFAGTGGLTAGFRAGSARFRSVGAVEMDKAAAASYAASFPETPVFADRIEDWLERGDVPQNVDVVVGGPPCQGFSTLGRQDAEDERNTLWRQYARTLVLTQPKYFVVENVAAFARSPQYLDFVAETGPTGSLRDYAFQHRILNAADYGSPQLRKRAVLIGYHRDLDFPGFPDPTHAAEPTLNGLKPYVTVGQALKGVPLEPDQDNVRDRVTHFHNIPMPGEFSPRDLHWSRSYTMLSRNRFANIPEGGNRFDLPVDLLAPCWVKHKTGSGDVMGRLRSDRPSVTIRTEFFKPEKGRYIHPKADRAITHYEAALLQGFPKEHRFIGTRGDIARQIGNAVPIPLGAAIARQLAKQF